jgi:hypothetical protein
MTEKLTTTLKIDNWDENPTQENDDGTKLTRAVVTLTEGADELKSGRFESLMHYKTDGTAAYVTVMRVEAELDGHTGAFTAVGEGTFDGTTASGTMHIVEGTGDLAGITGTMESSSTHADYPNMPLVVEYDLG